MKSSCSVKSIAWVRLMAWGASCQWQQARGKNIQGRQSTPRIQWEQLVTWVRIRNPPRCAALQLGEFAAELTSFSRCCCRWSPRLESRPSALKTASACCLHSHTGRRAHTHDQELSSWTEATLAPNIIRLLSSHTTGSSHVSCHLCTYLHRQMLARQDRAGRSASAASLVRQGDRTMPSSRGRPPPATTMSQQASTASVLRARPVSAATACSAALV
jgi:hypothetical protein